MKDYLKRALPKSLGDAIHRKVRGIGVPYDNVYHCCTWKSASQWFVKLFSHPLVMEHSEMGVMTLGSWFEQLKERGEVDFERPDDVRPMLHQVAPASWAYPRKFVGTTLYYTYEEFINLPLPADFRVFFVMRDPRDLVVSWYFSMRDSHVEHDWVALIRRELRQLDEDAGLRWVIQRLQEEGFYEILRSWNRAVGQDSRAALFRFEDLANDHATFVRKLFVWLNIRLPEEKLASVIADTAFEKIAGRKQGQEDSSCHLRKGVAGDWMNHQSDGNLQLLREVSGDLVSELGYDLP